MSIISSGHLEISTSAFEYRDCLLRSINHFLELKVLYKFVKHVLSSKVAVYIDWKPTTLLENDCQSYLTKNFPKFLKNLSCRTHVGKPL